MTDIAQLGIQINSSTAPKAVKELDALTVSAGKAEGASQKLGAASDKLAASTDKTSTKLQDAISALIKTNGALDAVTKSAQESAAAFDAFDRARASVEALRASIDPLYAASKQYERGLQTLDAALEQGVMSLTQHKQMVAQLGNAYLVSDAQLGRFGRGMQAASGHTANLMFQFQDIGMMLAAGQSPLILAMQQGTQVVGIFQQMKGSGQSAFSAIKGGLLAMVNPMSLLTIGAIAGGAALVQWGMSALGAGANTKDFKTSIDEVQAAIDAINNSVNVYTSDGLMELKNKYGEVNAEVVALIENQRLLALAEGTEKLNAALSAISAELGDGLFSTAYGEIEGVFQVTANQAQVLYGVIEGIGELDSIDRQLSTITRLKDRLSEATNGFTSMTTEQVAMLRLLTDAEDKARQLASATSKSATSADQLRAQMAAAYQRYADSRIAGAEMAAETKRAADVRLAQSMADAYGMYAATRNMATELANETERAAAAAASLNYGKLQNAYGSGVDAANRQTQDLRGVRPGKIAGGAGGVFDAPGGGGGGGSDPFKSDLEALIENLRTEREIEDEWYQENLAILQDRRAQEILGKQGHYEAMLSLNEEYQRRLREIDQAANSQRLTDMADLFGGLASIAQVGGQKTLKITAGLSAAQTIIAGYEAAMTAAAKAPTLAGKVAAYALWIGKSAQAVAAIRSAGGIGGGGGGGRGSIAAQGAGGQQAQAAEFRIYGFGRDKSYTGAELEQIFDGLHEVGKRRGIPVPTVVFV